MRFLALFLIFFVPNFIPAEETIRPKIYPEFEECVVKKVIDGDTIVVESPSCGEQRVRLVGIDAPENTKKKEAFGQDAKDFVERLIEESGGEVTLESDGFMYDRYDRRLAVVWIGKKEEEKQLNFLLVRNGLATCYTVFKFSEKNRERFFEAQKQAREERLRIWSDAGKELPCVRRALGTKSDSNEVGLQPEIVAQEQKEVGQYWISSTGKAHKETCRYYGEGDGFFSDEVEGKSICGICFDADQIEDEDISETDSRLWISSTGKIHRAGCQFFAKGNGHFYIVGERVKSACEKCGTAVPEGE